jgi:hypothetical protein
MNRIFKEYSIVLISLYLTACATMKESVLTGVGTGAVAGALVGVAIDKENSNGLWTGAAIGGVVGALTGYMIHSGLDDRDAKVRRDTLFNLEKYNVSHPSGSSPTGVNLNYTISAPNVETECFETQVRNGKLVQSHCESQIVGTPEWIIPKDQKGK